MVNKIFTKAEIEEIERRKKGNKSDTTGIFSSRIKPKIIEMLEYWFPQKKQLQKLVVKKINKPEVNQSHNNQENKPCEVSLNSSQT